MRTHLKDGEDGAEADADDEDEQEEPVGIRVALRVENRQQYKPASSDERAEYGERGQYAFPSAHVRNKSIIVSQVG